MSTEREYRRPERLELAGQPSPKLLAPSRRDCRANDWAALGETQRLRVIGRLLASVVDKQEMAYMPVRCRPQSLDSFQKE